MTGDELAAELYRANPEKVRAAKQRYDAKRRAARSGEEAHGT